MDFPFLLIANKKNPSVARKKKINELIIFLEILLNFHFITNVVVKKSLIKTLSLIKSNRSRLGPKKKNNRRKLGTDQLCPKFQSIQKY